MTNDRVRAECDTCSWACSGESFKVDDHADTHEYENPGHRVKVTGWVE